MADTLPTITFAPDATVADVVALYAATKIPAKFRSHKVQPCEDIYVERVDFMFADHKAAKRFVASLWEQAAWSFTGEAHVSCCCDYKVIVVLDVD